MAIHSKEIKENAIKRYLSGTSAINLGEELGVSDRTICNWVRKAGNSIELKKESEQKADLVIEYQRLDDSQRGKWLRTKGYESAHLEQWIKELKKEDLKNKELREENRRPKEKRKMAEREIRKKDKALAESAALLVLKKKYQHLWEDGE